MHSISPAKNRGDFFAYFTNQNKDTIMMKNQQSRQMRVDPEGRKCCMDRDCRTDEKSDLAVHLSVPAVT